MARPATGNARWSPADNRWIARITINGKREPVVMKDVPACLKAPTNPAPGCDCSSCEQARRVAKIISDKSRATGVVPVESGEVTNEWFADRYIPAHEANGRKTTQLLADWNAYVAPFIGTKMWRDVTPEDGKAIRDNLVRVRRLGAIKAKRAMNLWSAVVKSPSKRGFTDDDPDYNAVRVGPANANPFLNIKPPADAEDREEDDRERQALDPAYFVAFMYNEAEEIDWRRECAIKAFTGLRPAEFYGLKWPDVRLDVPQPIIKVQRARDMKTGKIVGLKNKQSKRDVPIHPELRPLLRAMRDEATDKEGFVMAIPDDRVREVEGNPARIRASLRHIGVTEPELIEGTESLRAFDDRSWRTTFATWCRDAGYDSEAIDAWLGHARKTTAAKHYKKGTVHFDTKNPRTAPVGVTPPFETLPAVLLSRPSFGQVLVLGPKRPSDSETLQCEGRDLNLGLPRPRASPEHASEPENTGANATDDPTREPTVSDGTARPESKPPPDPDEALKAAIKAAVDAGDLARASALLDVLKATPKPAPVLALAKGKVKP